MFNTSTWRVNPRQQIRQVRWIPPHDNWIKLNSAGVWRSSDAGAGGVFRNTNGSIVRGFMDKISAISNSDVELQALAIGLDIAKELGRPIWIELGAKEVVTLLVSKRLGAANLRHRIIDIHNKLIQVESRISHIHTQGNKVADVLAQQGSRGRDRIIFSPASAPAMVKALVRMDQLGLPSFRLRESSHGHEL